MVVAIAFLLDRYAEVEVTLWEANLLGFGYDHLEHESTFSQNGSF